MSAPCELLMVADCEWYILLLLHPLHMHTNNVVQHVCWSGH